MCLSQYALNPSVYHCHGESVSSQIRWHSLQSLLASVMGWQIFLFHRTSECMPSSQIYMVFWWTHESATLTWLPIYLISINNWVVSTNPKICLSLTPPQNNFLAYEYYKYENKVTVSFNFLLVFSSLAKYTYHLLTVNIFFCLNS